MEARLAEMKKTIKKLMELTRMLCQENAVLKRTNEELVGGGEPYGSKHTKSQRARTNTMKKEERHKMHLEFQELRDKYEEIAKQMGRPSTVDQLLISTNLSYNAGVMAIPLPPKFKVPQMEVYDKSKDQLEHLETLKVHITLHDFLEEIACQAFPLNLKGAVRT